VMLALYVLPPAMSLLALLVLLLHNNLAGHQREHVEPINDSVRYSSQLIESSRIIAAIVSWPSTILRVGLATLLASFYLFRHACKAATGALSGVGRVFRHEFDEEGRGVFYFLALTLGGLLTWQLVMAVHGACFTFVFLTIHMVGMATWESWLDIAQVTSARVSDTLVLLCMFHLQCFSVYMGLRRIWPVDDWQYYALAWTTGTGLCVWTITAYCVGHLPESRSPQRFIEW
jgi:hypothetical protein